MAAGTSDEGIALKTVQCIVTSPQSDIEEDIDEDVAAALPTEIR